MQFPQKALHFSLLYSLNPFRNLFLVNIGKKITANQVGNAHKHIMAALLLYKEATCNH